MPKQVQDLRERTGPILYVSDGKTLNQGTIEVGDKVQLFHENGTSITMAVDTIQEDNILIGTVTSMLGEAPGIRVGDSIRLADDFVIAVIRESGV